MKVLRIMFLFLVPVLMLSFTACDDSYWAKNYYKEQDGHFSWSTIETSDNGFLHVVDSFSMSDPTEAFLIKSNASGDIKWLPSGGGNSKWSCRCMANENQQFRLCDKLGKNLSN